MGVGYVIGPRIAGVMFAGGVLSWMVLLPLLSASSAHTCDRRSRRSRRAGSSSSEMTPNQMWSAYIRYIGAGAVLAAGIITLARTLPTIVSLLPRQREGLRAGSGAALQLRTERDLPMSIVLGGTVAARAVPGRLPRSCRRRATSLAALLVVVFGFFFVTVSSRIVGLIGSSSNPISGMTIATLILTCTIFVALGWTGDAYAPIALCRRRRSSASPPPTPAPRPRI